MKRDRDRAMRLNEEEEEEEDDDEEEEAWDAGALEVDEQGRLKSLKGKGGDDDAESDDDVRAGGARKGRDQGAAGEGEGEGMEVDDADDAPAPRRVPEATIQPTQMEEEEEADVPAAPVSRVTYEESRMQVATLKSLRDVVVSLLLLLLAPCTKGLSLKATHPFP